MWYLLYAGLGAQSFLHKDSVYTQDSSRRCCRPDSASGLGERGKLLRDPLCAAWEAGDGCRSRPTRPTPRRACKPTRRPGEAGLEEETRVRAREPGGRRRQAGSWGSQGWGHQWEGHGPVDVLELLGSTLEKVLGRMG